MYNGSNIFPKQHSHNLHLEGAHYLFPFEHFLNCMCVSPGNGLGIKTVKGPGYHSAVNALMQVCLCVQVQI